MTPPTYRIINVSNGALVGSIVFFEYIIVLIVVYE